MEETAKNNALTINEIHQVTLQVLKRIQEICKEHGITYFVAYGSLIGTIRHKGFIPWDDDFDIVMLRPDYERFCKICNKTINGHGNYALMNPENNKEYPFNISRFCDLRYRMIRIDGGPDAGMGIFIDVYPLDGLGNSRTFIHRVLEPLKQLDLRFLGLARDPEALKSKHGILKKIIRLPIWMLAHAFGKAFFYRFSRCIAGIHSIEDSKYIGDVVWDAGLVYYPKKYYEETVEVPFEDVMVPVPKEYDKVLRIDYGDYMQLPPEEERHPTHGYQIYRK